MRQFTWKGEARAPAKWLGLIVAFWRCCGSLDDQRLSRTRSGLYDAPGTTHVEMVVATTRTRSENPALLFGGGRAVDPAFADMVVSVPPDANRTIGQVQWPKQLPGNPLTDFVTLKADVINKDQAIATFPRLRRK